MGTTYLHAVASLDGYIAHEDDDVGPLHDWYFNGDHPVVDEDNAEIHGAPFRISAASVDYVSAMWSRQDVLVMGRHLFDLTNGWEGKPAAADHVVVVSHRPRPEGWHPEAPFDFETSIDAAGARPDRRTSPRDRPPDRRRRPSGLRRLPQTGLQLMSVRSWGGSDNGVLSYPTRA